MKKHLALLLSFAMVLSLLAGTFTFRAVDTAAVTDSTVEAKKTLTTPNLTEVDESWGAATIHINKDSRNCELFRYDGREVEDVEADLYFLWDNANLYIGMVSPDEEPIGSNDPWEGDGLQFKLQAGNVITGDAKNIYFSFLQNGVDFNYGEGQDIYQPSLKMVGGKMHAICVVPFEQLGMTASDVKAGAELAIQLLRIDSTYDQNGGYAGWLSWGKFFDYSVSEDDANIIKLVPATVDTPTVVKATKATSAPNMNKVDATWGAAAISIDKDAYNCELFRYDGREVEDVKADLYFTWDATNLYIGMVSPDAEPIGSNDPWEGDGLQFKIEAGNAITGDAKNIYFSFLQNGVDFNYGEGQEIYSPNLKMYDGKMHAICAVPFAELGLTASDVKAGAQFAIQLLRIDSTNAQNGGYAGWLSWGKFFDYSKAGVAANLIVLDGTETANPTVVDALKAGDQPNMEQVDGSWGLPAISIDKNAFNCELFRYDGREVEDVSADLYFLWDTTNLYIGMVSPDAEPIGSNDPWEGDGLQFKLEAGTAITGDAKNIYFSFLQNGVDFNYGENQEIYQPNLKMVGGKMHAICAVPFAELGLTASDIKAGAQFAIQLLRIDSTNAQNGGYAGWLSWGKFFDYSQAAVDVNIIKLKDTVVVDPSVVYATQNSNSPNMTKVDSTWGEKAISIDKNAFNCELFRYDGREVEDVKADLYFNWDNDNLYIGMVSPDAEPIGSNDPWEGDGLQFKIEAGTAITGAAKNIYFSFLQNGVDFNYGEDQEIYQPNLKMYDGKMHAICAVPFTELGMTASDVKAGAKLAIQLLRIDSTNAQNGGYAGWLSWGKFFDYSQSTTDVNTIVLKEGAIANPTVVNATKNQNSPNMNKVDSTWGEKAISIDKNTYNCELFSYDGREVEDVKADLYFNWDSENLYIGMVSPDAEPIGSNDPWEGDGLQFKIEAGTAITGAAKNIYFSFLQNGVDFNYGEDQEIYQPNLKMYDGKMHAICAVPFTELGMTASDVKVGAKLAIQLLRIDSTNAQNGGYAGWLSWGKFFDYSKADVSANIIVLKDGEIANPTVVDATKNLNTPNMTKVDATWGEKAITIDKDAYNCELFSYDGREVEDVKADLYFNWDADYLYIGMVSPDAEPIGSNDPWEGDGLQFKIEAGTAITGAAKNIYFSFLQNGEDFNWGEDQEIYRPSLKMVDGKMHAICAVPFTELGMTSSDVKPGAKLAIQLLRIDSTNAQNGGYAGWLSWGKFFDYSKADVAANIIVLQDALTDNPTVVEANKTDAAPNMTKVDTTWGDAVITVDKNSYNAELFRYDGREVEDVKFDLYLRWDAEKLYIGMVSPDAEPIGSNDPWEGDGLQFKLEAGNAITGAAKNIYFSFLQNGEDFNWGEDQEIYSPSLKMYNGKMHAICAVPFAELGMTASDVKAGATLAIQLLRIDSTNAQNGGYAGWLSWGKFFEYSKADSDVNIIVLVDKEAAPEEEEPEDEFVSKLTDVAKTALTMKPEQGMDTTGHKMATTAGAAYAVYLNIGNRLKDVYHEFTLVEIKGTTAKEVAYDYIVDGTPDVYADSNDNVYVVAAASSWAIKRLTKEYDNYKVFAQAADLTVWKYNPTKGVANEIVEHFDFEGTTDNIYTKTATVMGDDDNIYVLMQDGANYVVYKFDTAAGKWSQVEAGTAASADIAMVSDVFDGYLLITSGEGEKNIDTMIYGGGSAYKLFEKDGHVYFGNETESMETGFAPTDMLSFFECTEGLFIARIESTKAAWLEIWSVETGEKVADVELDKDIIDMYPLMTEVEGNTLNLFFAGKRAATKSWYLAQLDLEALLNPEEP